MLRRALPDIGPPLASSTAGLGSVFVAIGDRRLMPGGRMALVLPEALGFGVAWEKTPQLFAQRYIVELLIVSHDPERWKFSENTDLSEIMVVARKRMRSETPDGARTVCVNLWRNTTTIVDAMALADAIEKAAPADVDGGGQMHGVCSIRVGSEKRGEAVHIEWEALRGGQWYPCAFAQTDLVRTAHFLRKCRAYLPGVGIVGDVPMVALGSIGTLGPDRRDIKDGFDDVPYPTAYPAFWSHDADRMMHLEAAANRFLEPLSAPRPSRNLKPVSHLWPKAGRVMLVEGLRANTQRIVAVRLPHIALSNVWWSLHLNTEDADAEKALTLWLNSTPGLLALLSYRVPTHGPWMHFKKDIYERMPVLDTGKLSAEQTAKLAAAYDHIAQAALQSFPQMSQDPVRAAIDAAIAHALGLPPLDGLRQALAREPVVCSTPLYGSNVSNRQAEARANQAQETLEL
jgi:hypothetical protein